MQFFFWYLMRFFPLVSSAFFLVSYALILFCILCISLFWFLHTFRSFNFLHTFLCFGFSCISFFWFLKHFYILGSHAVIKYWVLMHFLSVSHDVFSFGFLINYAFHSFGFSYIFFLKILVSHTFLSL